MQRHACSLLSARFCLFQGGMTEDNRPGALVTYDFAAGATGQLEVKLMATADDQAFADDNPILNAFTVERL